MNSTLTITNPIFTIPKIAPKTHSTRRFFLHASSSSTNGNSKPNPLISTLKSTGIAAVVFTSVALGKFPVRAENPPPPATTVIEEQQNQENEEENYQNTPLTAGAALRKFPVRAENPEQKNQENEENYQNTPLTQFLESNSEAIEALKNLLQEKLESGQDEESLKILNNLVLAQPENVEWKFLIARLLNEMGKIQESREVFEEILSKTPLSFEALFENALLMDRCGEGVNVIKRLEEALRLAEEEEKVKECRDIRFIIAQVQFLQKDIDEALRSYDELEKEDPKDFRPYFCRGMIYSLLDRNKEAREQFAKYRELSPKKFEVEGYLRTALSRMKLFGTDEKES